MTVHIGTSGWSYKHWIGAFYPDELATTRHFEYFCEHFSTVEINSTFYNMPKKKTFFNWQETAPPEFVFSIKASRFITHIKGLKDVAEPLDRLLKGCSFLGDKMGPLLFQLPPGFKKDEKMLNELLELIPANITPVVEFRHPSWFEASVYDILEKRNCAFCWHDYRKMECPEIVTAKTAYLRLHAPDGHYGQKYSEAYLKKLAGKIQEYDQKKYQVFVYFNNDLKGYAVENALQLKKLVGC